MAKCIYVTVDVTRGDADLLRPVTYSGHDPAQRETMRKIWDKVCTVFVRGFLRFGALKCTELDCTSIPAGMYILLSSALIGVIVQSTFDASKITVLVLGRSSGAKAEIIEVLVKRLLCDGASTQNFQRKWYYVRSEILFCAEMKFGESSVIKSTSHPILKQLAYAATIISFPRFWSAIPLILLRRKPPVRELKNIIRYIHASGKSVLMVSHSAGGILGTLVECEPAVVGHICFGYPFKHPDRPPESYRTRFLRSIRKPFLIVQGNQDEYGTSADAAQYSLSRKTTVLKIDGGHDYSDFTEGTVERIHEAARKMIVDDV